MSRSEGGVGVGGPWLAGSNGATCSGTMLQCGAVTSLPPHAWHCVGPSASGSLAEGKEGGEHWLSPYGMEGRHIATALISWGKGA